MGSQSDAPIERERREGGREVKNDMYYVLLHECPTIGGIPLYSYF
jgi:hypothetical protein